ncbi:hypothetical protein RF11_13926 [Thelohanellus kitauei]|uniref:Uncharacterized protein n=1 Tax=Thelohanellus kitauei TaxID=669202 RepID=A0A0C2I6X6_THEKT|nr:hypothetical protein RF11_13926 [Thelohanellus kitauei]
MSEDVRCPLISGLQHVNFAFPPEECTDIANTAQMLDNVQYFWEGEVFEDFLFDKSLPGRNWTGLDIMSWRVHERAAVMTGRDSGLVERIKIVVPHIVSTDCTIHLQPFAAKVINENLADVPLNQALVENMCLEMEAEHKYLLLHAKHNESMAHFYTHETWVIRLAYLADIFNILNSNYGMFLLLADFLTDNNISTHVIAGAVLNHLQEL